MKTSTIFISRFLIGFILTIGIFCIIPELNSLIQNDIIKLIIACIVGLVSGLMNPNSK